MLPLKIAFRFLISNSWQSLLIILGMAVAVSIQVFVGLLISSLQFSLVDTTVRNMPQITITSGNSVPSISGWTEITDKIQRTGLVTAVSPAAGWQATTYKSEQSIPLIIKGVNFEEADRIYNFKKALYSGEIHSGSREVIIGRELAEELELGLGDKLTVTTPDGAEIIFTVTGLYDLGSASVNKSWVITNMRTVQQLFDLPGRITTIEMTVSDVFAADTTAAILEKELNNGNLKIDNWKDQNRDLMEGLRSQGISSIIIQFVIIISVIIAISSVLAITVMQKSRQIGILKAMGITDLDASLIFIYEGLLLGLIGSVSGVALGLGILYVFDKFFSNSAITIIIDFGFVFISWLIALSASTLAGLFPARKSLHLNPIDVIREG